MKRDLFSLAPSKPTSLVRRLRAIAFGTAVTGVALVQAQPAGAAPTQVGDGTTTVLTPTIVDRARKTRKLLLKLPGQVGSYLVSHGSHSSHSSHASHSSHYSGTSGVVRTPNEPAPVAPTTPDTAAPLAANPAAATEVLTAKFVSFNRLARTMTVKDAVGTTYEFGWRDDTIVTGLERMDNYLEAHHGLAPWNATQSLTITWKPSLDGTKRVATAIR